jgi:glucose-6-phosphate isomerase/transaldolase/glucose-6-phosphate isomerase
MRAQAADLEAWAASVDASRVVLLGMGGSSLGPEVLRAAIDSDRLMVLDSTDPSTVAAARFDADSFFLVSSKSGTTLEVNTLLAYAWEHVPDGSRYAAITDPGTALAALAAERGFHRTFENPPDIGGRYSVLSYFGLVPAALLGYDVAALCDSALGADPEAGVALGVAMGEAQREGRDKITVVPPASYAAFGLWVEQLIAESTGKRGTGLIPVPTTDIEQGDDRHVVALDMDDPLDLGEEFFRWEVAVAIAGHMLGIDPFDEPNVTESKENTGRVLDALPLPNVPTEDPGSVSTWLEGHVRPRDYVSIQAYLPYGQNDALHRLRRTLRDGLGGTAVTVGYGPRFLHSTGQLHKGGPNEVVALQIVPTHPTAELPIPGFGYDFGTLIAAQAIGDHQSLLDHDRRVLRVAVDDLRDIR